MIGDIKFQYSFAPTILSLASLRGRQMAHMVIHSAISGAISGLAIRLTL